MCFCTENKKLRSAWSPVSLTVPQSFGESFNWHLSAGQPDIIHQNVQAHSFLLTNPLLVIDSQQIIE